MSFGKVADDGRLLRRDAHMDELLKPAARGDDTECAILGAHQLYRGLHDPLEHNRQFEMLNDGEVGPQQSTKAPLGREHILGTIDEITKSPIQFAPRLVRKGEPFIGRDHRTPLSALSR